MEEHQRRGVDIVERLELREEYAESMQEADWVGKPWDVGVEENRRDDEHAGYVMDEE